MSDALCPCCGSVDESNTENTPSAGEWIRSDTPLDAALPPKLQSALGRFLGKQPVETLDEWVTEVRQYAGGTSISTEDLCHLDQQSEHWGTVNGERYYFACFYDAVILAALSEQPVDIRTKSPDGSVIEARAVGSDSLAVTSKKAVFSFGIDASVTDSTGNRPSLDVGYAAICPYVRAFSNPDAYERWAKTVHAPTVAMPLAGATELAMALVKDSSR